MRQEGLRQVGFIVPLRSLNAANALSTEELFYRNRYKRMKFDKNDPNAYRHNPLDPVAYTDSSLDAFAPRQWQGDLPPPVRDDLLQRAIEGLKTTFSVTPNIVRAGRYVTSLIQPVTFTFTAMVPEQLNIGYAEHLMELNLRVIVSHPASGKVLSHLNRRISIPKDQPRTVVSGELTVLSSTNLSGSFRVVAQILINEDQDSPDEYSDNMILRTHGPLYVQIIRD